MQLSLHEHGVQSGSPVGLFGSLEGRTFLFCELKWIAFSQCCECSALLPEALGHAIEASRGQCGAS